MALLIAIIAGLLATAGPLLLVAAFVWATSMWGDVVFVAVIAVAFAVGLGLTSVLAGTAAYDWVRRRL